MWVLKTALRFCFPYIIVNIMILILATLMSLAVTFINRAIVNELSVSMARGQISTLFVGLVITYLLIYFCQQASGFLQAFGNNFFRFNVNSLFRRLFMWKSYNTPQDHFYNPKFMETYSFVSGQTDKISSYISSICGLIFSNIGAIIGSMALFAVYEPALLIYSIMIGVVSLLLNKYLAKKQYELDKKQVPEQRYNDYYRSVLTGKDNAKEMRIYRLSDFFYEKWFAVYDKLRIERLVLEIRKIRLFGAQSLIKLLLRIAAIAILIYGVYTNRYDIGTFVMLFGLVESCSNQMDGLAATIIRGTYKDVKYLNDYYDMICPISNNEIRQIQKNGSEFDRALPYGDFRDLIAENISYRYPAGDKNAVENVSLTIKKGEIISILGYNGSGKTTLSKLLNGSLFPQNGTVKINGVPISPENHNEVFRYFGNAPQEFPHFSLPLCEVVGLGKIEKMNNKNELEAAYEKAGLSDIISKLEHGDQTILGKEYDDEGVDLSGGQWQSLIIANAYMGQPEILILDEPTASIDPLKEMEMLKNFRKNLSGKTAVLISHRIGFARLADRIIMMENGKITEQGTHDELIKANGTYAKLFYTQKELYEEATA